MSATPSVLVVDDEVDTCRNLSDILTDMGFRVDTAYDGPQALALVKKNHYDVALLDYKMPGMDGLNLYGEIKKLRAGTVAIASPGTGRRWTRRCEKSSPRAPKRSATSRSTCRPC